jgi:hypothetical protein
MFSGRKVSRQSACFFGRVWLQDENVLAAQIHHLIRKRFCHLIRKIILT